MQAANERQYPRGQKPHWIDVSNLFVLTATLVAIVVYAYIAYKQWGVMHDTLIASERAWVLLDKVDLQRTIQSPDGKNSAYQVVFRNFGKGPATDVSICADATTTKADWRTFKCDIRTEIVTPPGGETYITVVGPSVGEFVKQVYISGGIKYLDQFGIPRETEYCISPRPRDDGNISIGACDRNRAK